MKSVDNGTALLAIELSFALESLRGDVFGERK